jgi:DNA-binding transcriptional regulator YhcF (GntR family)
MEDEGFVVTPRNAASTLRVTPALLERFSEELGRDFVRAFVLQARRNGLSYKRVIELISHYWEEDV